jgi:hypothetical protein
MIRELLFFVLALLMFEPERYATTTTTTKQIDIYLVENKTKNNVCVSNEGIVIGKIKETDEVPSNAYTKEERE